MSSELGAGAGAAGEATDDGVVVAAGVTAGDGAVAAAEGAVNDKPLGAPRGRRPRIRISCVDQLGHCRCHHGHKPGDVFDFDRDRGKMCSMACHVGFPYIDILRYGGTVPGNAPGTAKFCCPEVDTLNVWLAEIVKE